MTEILLTALGVTLPSLLVFLAVKRWLEPVSWRVGALLIALVFVFTARGVFTSAVPMPLDEVMRGYPYHGLYPVEKSKNYLTNDTVKQILPWMHVVREQLGRGRAPLWNPYLFSGYPLLGNGQSAPFSPFFLATLFVPLPKQMVAMAGVKLFVALLFGFLLIRRERVSDAAAIFGSVVFAFAIFNNAFLYYPMTAVTLLLPAAAYAVLLCLRRPSGAPIVLVALTVAALLAGGHPESVVHVALAVLALVIIEAIAPQWAEARFTARDLGRAACAALLGLVISAPAWVPVAEQSVISLRVLSLKGAPTGVAFPLKTLWAMLNPDGFGNPAHGNYSWIMSYTHVASVYLGLIVTVLLATQILSPRAARRDRLLMAFSIVFFLVSLHWTPLARIAYAVPPLSWVAHDRLRFVVCFLVGIAAARAVARLRNWDVVIALTTSAVVLALAIYVFVKMYGRTLTPISSIGIAALAAFLVVVIVRRNFAPAAALALTALELLVFTFDYNALTDRRYYAPKLPIIEALHSFAAAAPPEPFRVLGLDWVFLPNAAAQYELEDVRGSDPMEWADYVRFFRAAEMRDDSIDVKRIADPNSPAIDFLNVRYLLAEPGARLGGKWQRLYSGVDGELYENSAFMPRFFVPKLLRRVPAGHWEQELSRSSDYQETPLVHGPALPEVIVNPPDATVTCRVHGPTDFRLRVAAPGPAFVASSQPAMPWWRVTVNGVGVRIVRVNGAFIGFRVPAGTSDVAVRYRPLPYRASVALSLLGMVILGAWARFSKNRGIGVGV